MRQQETIGQQNDNTTMYMNVRPKLEFKQERIIKQQMLIWQQTNSPGNIRQHTLLAAVPRDNKTQQAIIHDRTTNTQQHICPGTMTTHLPSGDEVFHLELHWTQRS